MEDPTKTLFRRLYSDYFPLILHLPDNKTVSINYILELEKDRLFHVIDKFPVYRKKIHKDEIEYTVEYQSEFPNVYYTDILIELVNEYLRRMESFAERAENLRKESVNRTDAIADLVGKLTEEKTPSSNSTLDPESFVDSINPWFFYGSAVIAGIAIAAGVYFFSKRKA